MEKITVTLTMERRNRKIVTAFMGVGQKRDQGEREDETQCEEETEKRNRVADREKSQIDKKREI